MWALSTPKEKTPTAALRAAKRGGDFDLRATHAGKLLPAALTSVSFGFVLVRSSSKYKQKHASGPLVA